MKLIPCSRRHAQAILDIFNDAIITSTALYDYKPRTLETMAVWFDLKDKTKHPVIGVESDEGVLMGFATYGIFRDKPAFKYSVEHSVYVAPKFRGKGVGRFLLKELIEIAKFNGLHMMIGAIDASNQVSVHMHKSMGFEHCGTIKQTGFKFGKWLDLDFYQLILPSPANPTDG
jgi:phosphinothricin acetyltransferase